MIELTDVLEKRTPAELAQRSEKKVAFQRANVLLVGDQVNLFVDHPRAAFGWGTVVAVAEHFVEVVRPFVHTSDFIVDAGEGEIGDRLLSYIGQEVTRLPRNSERIFKVVFRTTTPR